MKLSASTRRFLRAEPTRTRSTVPMGQKRKKLKLYDRQGGRCLYCSNKFPIDRLTIDHVLRKREGGGNGIQNLVLACQPCNTRRELPETASVKVLARWADWHRQYVIDYAL